jgi:hypothetical protein
MAVLLVHECTSGVNPLSRCALWRIPRSVRETWTIVLATHARSLPSSSTHRMSPVVPRQSGPPRRDRRRAHRARQVRRAGSACRPEATHVGSYGLTGGRASSPQLVVSRLRRRRHLTAQCASAHATLRSSRRPCGRRRRQACEA